jgi:membrane protein
MLFSLLTMLFAATGAFAGLQRLTQFNLGVRPLPGLGLGAIVCDRLLSFGMVLVIGFLLIVRLLISDIVQSLAD